MPGPPVVPQLGSIGDILQRGGFPQLIKIHQDYYNEFGPVVRMEMGEGNKEVLTFNPLNFLKVIQAEAGNYPEGGFAFAWPFHNYYASRGIEQPLSTVGPEWSTRRGLLQKDLFTPKAALSYLPLFEEVTREASQYINQQDDMAKFLNRFSFDMFTAIVCGISLHTVSPSVKPEDMEFIHHAARTMQLAGQMLLNPGRTEELYPLFVESMDIIGEHGQKICRQAIENPPKDAPAESYAVRLHKRGELTFEQLHRQLTDLLFAGVDTTSHVLTWAMINIAAHPRVQEKLVEELNRVAPDGTLTEQNVNSVPYLDSILRESHRRTPASTINTLRRTQTDMVFDGYHVPKGTRVNLMHGLQWDPKICDNPEQFIPERWSPEEKQKRKGTPKEILDHVLLSSPFGAGARMCLGSRVANKEIAAMLARIFSDWLVEWDPPGQKYEAITTMFIMPVPFPRLKFTPRHKATI